MRRFLCLSLLMLIAAPPSVAWADTQSQVIEDPDVEALLTRMGPEERVGQLFLVTYYGSDVSETSDIAMLISRYHVGGVVLLAENDNFSDSDDLPTQVAQLTSNLQRLAAERPSLVGTPEMEYSSAPFVPLFIGLEHDGSGQSHTQLFSGMTPLPSSMAIGATWDPDMAENIGQIVGQELPVLGVNLLLGPSADVLEDPNPFTSGDLGTWVFGGEPFWVSRMTAAYVRGVHEGSNGRLAVVPRHFPGHGGADRLASVEVPTVRRSLEQLKQFDLIPFFAVTDLAKDPLYVADGLMTGHISYLDLQGDNPRVVRPISLDNRVLQQLMALEPVASWRSSGGLIISDSLGARGVRRQYPQGETFPGRRIAQDALTAGNDILYLSDFREDAAADQTDNIIDMIEFFVQAYQSDSAFQERVDDAVRHILHKKLELYDGHFDLDTVVRFRASEIAALGQRGEVTSDVARSALTLLSPSRADVLRSPQEGERIVIFTDTRSVKQCSDCIPRPMIAGNALQAAILRLYGPEASKLVTLASIQSFTFDQLADYLEYGPQESIGTEDATPVPDSLDIALISADWVVFVMLDVNTSVPSSNAVKRFLAVRPVDPDTQIVVMAMGAPYYLDSTEIGQLTAYYGLYGHTEQFVDVAARALFSNTLFPGASPVSVAGTNYDIVKMTSPDPDQIIKLSWYKSGNAAGETPTPAPAKGDVVQLSTGVILDRNMHPVPDGTPVEFIQNYTNEGLSNSISATTVDGIARTSLTLDRAGELKITLSSIDATRSDIVTINVSDTGEVSIDVFSPDIIPTATLPPTVTPTLTPAIPPSTPPDPPDVRLVGTGDLLLSLLGLGVISAASFVFGISRRNLNYGLLLSLATVIFGLTGYNYYALYWPGASSWRMLLGDTLGAGTMTWISSSIGFGLVILILYTLDRWPRVSLGGRNRRNHR
ncbi:MAG: hypothetical protein JXB30_08385 [Anaerolineae bacterium]|nr:hypothetical protein [Anaerolineae bacterium]